MSINEKHQVFVNTETGEIRDGNSGARIAPDVPGGLVAPATGIAELAALLAHSWAVVGLDTGLTHLAVALGRPTVGIYCATEPALTGLHGDGHAVNLGGPGAPPTAADVAMALGCAEHPEE